MRKIFIYTDDQEEEEKEKEKEIKENKDLKQVLWGDMYKNQMKIKLPRMQSQDDLHKNYKMNPYQV